MIVGGLAFRPLKNRQLKLFSNPILFISGDHLTGRSDLSETARIF